MCLIVMDESSLLKVFLGVKLHLLNINRFLKREAVTTCLNSGHTLCNLLLHTTCLIKLMLDDYYLSAYVY